MYFQIPEPIRDIVIARDRLRALYRSSALTFTLDGNLLGDIGEAVAQQLFGIELASRNTRTVDGYAPDGRSVQVKAGASLNGPAFRNTDLRADHLIVIRFDLQQLVGEVLYNGPEEPIVRLLPPNFSGQRTVSLNRIRAINETVEPTARLPLTAEGRTIVVQPPFDEPRGERGKLDGEFLMRDAARDFMFLTRLSDALGILDKEERELRLRILGNLLSLDDHLRDALEGEVGGEDPGEIYGDIVPEQRDGAETGDWRDCAGAPESDPLLLHFSSVAPGLGAWTFYPQDRDPKPSVPHGHWQGRRQPKLNPYTGRVFDRNGEVKRMRLGRKAMKALWNDKAFRRNVLEAVVWYAREYPWHRFPVDKPNRLPRRS